MRVWVGAALSAVVIAACGTGKAEQPPAPTTTEGQRQFGHATIGDRARVVLRLAAGGAQAPEEPERPATTSNARLELLYD